MFRHGFHLATCAHLRTSIRRACSSNQPYLSNAAGSATIQIRTVSMANVDIRVGKIVSATTHIDSSKLFIEQIDVGDESGPRQIVSGLQEFYALDELEGRRVMVVCNLPKAKLAGEVSLGMVLCAELGNAQPPVNGVSDVDADSNNTVSSIQVEFVEPPVSAPIGATVLFGDLLPDILSTAQMKKRKVWRAVADELNVVNGVAMWMDVPLRVEGHDGFFTTRTIKHAKIK
eukprot:m.116902 g.116902  ORF g.116902 m.116902 type:complete len:230 (+) comp28543_c0_seq2:221-910(+)